MKAVCSINHSLVCSAPAFVGAERPIQHLDITSQKPHQVRLNWPTVARSEAIGIVMLGSLSPIS